MNPIQRINNKTILLSPLDWGFGHTTRCVSIIRDLLLNNNDVIFAGNNSQISFITKEFPLIKTEFIDGYNVYLSSEKSTYFQIANQSVKILKAIKHETKWVKNHISKHKIDLIISDNRYGFRHHNIESIFLGHQLNIELPLFKRLINKKLANHINQFNTCWIPDDEKLNLTGLLSNTDLLKIPFKYIGLLSRFTHKETPMKYDYLFLVSGPHPENTLFLSQIEYQIKNKHKRFAIVSSVISKNKNSNCAYFHLPSSKELNQLLNESNLVISKAGYTTIMELVALNKKTILTPTKGQFEQEYLAKHIQIKNLVFIDSIEHLAF